MGGGQCQDNYFILFPLFGHFFLDCSSLYLGLTYLIKVFSDFDEQLLDENDENSGKFKHSSNFFFTLFRRNDFKEGSSQEGSC